MAAIKPSKPEFFNGCRDALTVNSWLYQMETYLNLITLGNPQLAVEETAKIAFASTFLKGIAASWWFSLVQSGQAPGQWEAFVSAVKREFIPQDSVQRSRERLRNLSQRGNVSSYLDEFRNIVIGIPGISEDEKLDKFCAGLKPAVRLEVLKAGPSTVDGAACIALNVDNAMYNVGTFNNRRASLNVFGEQPMDIGNVESRPHYRGRSFNANSRRNFQNTQKKTSFNNNACYVCQKQGCRAWKHKNDGLRSSTAERGRTNFSSSMSEN